jgi:tetratricopeptide (TPR) repeat protein
VTDAIEQLLEYALQLAARIERASLRVIRYIEIAEIYLGMANKSRCLEILVRALQNIDSVKRPLEKAKILAWLARVCAGAGDGTRAKEQFIRATLLARAAETTSQKSEALYRIACEYAGGGLSEEADRVLSELYELTSQSEKGAEAVQGLIDIAEIYADLQQDAKATEILAEALGLTPAIEDIWFRSERLSEIAGIYAGAGFPEKALPVLEQSLLAVNRIGQANRPYFLLKIAEIYQSLGDRLKAVDILQKILDIVDQDELAYSRSGGLIEVAGQYTQLGDSSASVGILLRARDIAAGIEDAKEKIINFIAIGLGLGAAGQAEKALDMADKSNVLCLHLVDKRARVHLLGRLALLYAGLNSKDQSAAAISGIIGLVRESRAGNSSLPVIAADLAEAGEYGLALELTQIIREPEALSSALTVIAGSLAEAHPEADEQIRMLVRGIVPLS